MAYNILRGRKRWHTHIRLLRKRFICNIWRKDVLCLKASPLEMLNQQQPKDGRTLPLAPRDEPGEHLCPLSPKGSLRVGSLLGRHVSRWKMTAALPPEGVQYLETRITENPQLRGTFNRATGRSTNRRRKNSGGIWVSSRSRLADANAHGALPGSSRVLNCK